jgi:hypothetical protein
MTSPLGAYGPLVAAIVGVGVVAVFLLATVFQVALGLSDADLSSLRELALLALGAIYGTTAGAASSRQDIAATNRRLDAIGAPTAAEADRVTHTGGA